MNSSIITKKNGLFSGSPLTVEDISADRAKSCAKSGEKCTPRPVSASSLLYRGNKTMRQQAANQSSHRRNVSNRQMYLMDNYTALKGMNTGIFDAVVTDPPFRKGRDFESKTGSRYENGKFSDTWHWSDIDEGWLDAITDNEVLLRYLDGVRDGPMRAYLTFMAPRIVEMHRVLSSTGIYVQHCDWEAVHHLRALCDVVFGYSNFVNELIWERKSTGGGTAKNKAPVIEDRILVYKKSKSAQINQISIPMTEESVRERYQNPDNDPRGCWRSDPLHTNGRNSQIGLGEREFDGLRGTWKYTDEEMQELKEQGLLVRSGNRWRIKKFLKDCDKVDGKPSMPCPTILPREHFPPVGHRSKEDSGYPTGKPPHLYAALVGMATDEGGWVLDPFAGGGTTLVAAELGDRNWVGIDWMESAPEDGDGLKIHKPPAEVLGEQLSTHAKSGKVEIMRTPPQRDLSRDDDYHVHKSLAFDVGIFSDPPPNPRDAPINKTLLKLQRSVRCDNHCEACDVSLDAPGVATDIDRKQRGANGGVYSWNNTWLLCTLCHRSKTRVDTLLDFTKDEVVAWFKGLSHEVRGSVEIDAAAKKFGADNPRLLIVNRVQ